MSKPAPVTQLSILESVLAFVQGKTRMSSGYPGEPATKEDLEDEHRLQQDLKRQIAMLKKAAQRREKP